MKITILLEKERHFIALANIVEIYKVGKGKGCQDLIGGKMRRTILIQGDLMRDLPKPIDEAVNTVIAKNPEFELIQTVVLHSSNSSCTLLCVFEKKDVVLTEEEE